MRTASSNPFSEYLGRRNHQNGRFDMAMTTSDWLPTNGPRRAGTASAIQEYKKSRTTGSNQFRKLKQFYK